MKENLTFLQQAELFKKRGVKIDNLESAAQKLETISYYKLKEFAEQFNVNKNKYDIEPEYRDISFEDIVKRYYQDKNLRIYLIHALEKIEVSLKTRIGYELGKLGAYGYLNEGSWMDRGVNFEKNKTSFKDIFDKHCNKKTTNIKEEDYPSVWIFVNSLMFGEIVKIYEFMSRKIKWNIANYYKLDINELGSFIRTMRLIRNLSAHNNKIIDLRLRSISKVKNEWKEYLEDCNKKDSCHLALIILMIKYFIDIINPKYSYKNIIKTVKSIIGGSDDKARCIGFKDKETFEDIFKIE